MKLKTTALLASLCVLASTAGAFAIPIGRAPLVEPPVLAVKDADGWQKGARARLTAGETLLVDARLGHATLAQGRGVGASGETYLFAQVAGSDDKLAAQRTGLDLAIVIDRSGSMKGDRIANAMNAAVFALERMRDGDTISVVSFDTRADVVVPPTSIRSSNRSSIESAIRSIRLGGDTCISCGLEEGMAQLSRTATFGAAGDSDGRLRRMILLSDGATNAGVRDASGLRAMANRMHGRGVSISTIGVDVDFDEKIMAAIASEANGRHYFVANSSGLPAVFGQEFDDLLSSVAKDAELAIELAPGVEVEEVFDRTFRREGRRLIVSFGTFSAKQEKTVLAKLRVPTDREGEAPVGDLKLTFRDLVKGTEGACSGNLALTVTADGSEQRELDPFVAARLERSRTAQSLTDANKLFEAGRFGEARAKLAERREGLKKTESAALALAAASPTSAPRHAARPLDRDFADQAQAVAEAERTFAAPPAPRATPGADAVGRSSGGASGPFAPAPVAAAPSREGKAQVRANQEKASSFGF